MARAPRSPKGPKQVGTLNHPANRLNIPTAEMADLAAMQEEMERTPTSGVVGALRGMAIRPDRREQLREIAAPALVVVGEEDVISPPEEARAMAEALPNGRLAVIPGAGHLAPYEDPEAFNAAVLAFLKDLHPHA